MLVEVKVPQLSESIAEATLLSWHKKQGEAVKRDENLIDIETDKVVLELPAPADGVLVSVSKGDGSTVVANEVIATINTEAQPTAARAATDPAVSMRSAAAVPQPSAVPQPASAPPPVSAQQTAVSPQAAAKAEIVTALPAARKMMADNDVAADAVAGTGRGGRVTKGDVITHLDSAKPVATPPPPASKPAPVPSPVNIDVVLGDRPEQRVPMSRLRARIAERLVQSQQTAAILTTFNEVNMQPIIDLRNRYKDRFEKEHGVKLGFMSFFVKAAVHGLKKFPVVNASVDGTDIVYHGYYDIGIAVGSPRGLVVPIIRDADKLSLATIEKKIADFGNRAKDGKLGIEELTGGTFSISNGGVFGSMLSTPIINPPTVRNFGYSCDKGKAGCGKRGNRYPAHKLSGDVL